MEQALHSQPKSALLVAAYLQQSLQAARVRKAQ
jgi:hypothetical protein